ncbi:MAG: hypothetical protein IH602_04480 [Bryobacteraceae bacterium]|nr:hypothetical protein [Bryobacteraceae bacterium]
MTSPPCHTADPEGKQFFSEVIRASSEALALDPGELLSMTPVAALTLALDRVRAIEATIGTLQRQADALGSLRALLHRHETARTVDAALRGAA